MVETVMIDVQIDEDVMSAELEFAPPTEEELTVPPDRTEEPNSRDALFSDTEIPAMKEEGGKKESAKKLVLQAKNYLTDAWHADLQTDKKSMALLRVMRTLALTAPALATWNILCQTLLLFVVGEVDAAAGFVVSYLHYLALLASLYFS
ncbi:MAG: hypothetical protein MHM6MM_002909 [Cercozoa sp. M6MM]